jgi:GxxExxY protein
MTHIIHKDLSYAVKGACFDVHNALGRGIRCETEKSFEVYYRDARVGLYFVDMWLEDGKLLLELKVAPAITAMHKAQTLSYLKVTGADLGIIVNFGEKSLTAERLPNYLCDKKVAFEWQPPEIGKDWLYPDLTQRLFEALHRIHFELGPGFLHQVYRRATMVELRHQDVGYRYIKELPIRYLGEALGVHPVRLINVAGQVLVATFAVKQIDEAMKLQLRARLKQFGLQLGLLANFNGTSLDIVPVRAG